MAKPSETSLDGDELRGIISVKDKMTATDKAVGVATTGSSNTNPKQSKANEVSNIFELVESILNPLTFEDIVQAQRVCRTTRDVIAQTPRFTNTRIVYQPGLWLATPPFCQIIDFCIPSRDQDRPEWLYLLGSHPSCHFDADGDERGVMRLFFDLSDHLRPDWKVDEEGYVLGNRAIIGPDPGPSDAELLTLPAYQTLQLWRDVAWTSDSWGGEDIMVEIVVRSKCEKRHATEDRMLFERGATLGLIVAWLAYFLERWPTKVCPGGVPDFCHRRRFHLEGDTLHASTTDGVEREKVMDKPFE